MTYNVDEGTDYLEVGAATNLTQFLIAVGQTITQVRATKPPERMKAVAAQIIAAAPTLVSLQELDQWFSGSFDPVTQTCGPVTLEFDLLQELLDALAARGASYEVAVQARQFAFPPTPGLIVLINTPLGPLPEPRAWVSVDANFNGKPFRFIGTHLESTDPAIRRLQGGELRAGPTNTSLPVIVAMDSNAQAAPPPQDAAYADFIAAGYKDAWSQIFRTMLGLTCCQAQLVNNLTSQLTQRIDLILRPCGLIRSR